MRELPEGWVETTLGEVATIKGGKRLPKGMALVAYRTKHPYIRITDLDNNAIKKGQLQFVTDEVFSNISRYIVNSGDVIVSIVGTIGLVAKIDNDLDAASLTENCVKFINLKDLISDYLYYYLLSRIGQHEINKNTVGAVQKKLPIYGVQNIQINLPPLPEQKAIADMLSSFDDKIELLREQNKTLETLAQTIFKEWFVYFNGGESTPISELVEFNPIERIDRKKEYLFFDMKTLSTNSMATAEGVFKKSNSGTSFREGDTLFAKITPCLENGKTAFVLDLKGETVARGSTEFIVMRAKKRGSPFLNYCICRDNNFREYAIQSMTGTSGRQRVPVDRLKTYEIQYSQENISKFNDAATPCFEKIKNNAAQIQSLSKTRDTLLPRLLSGEVQVEAGDFIEGTI